MKNLQRLRTSDYKLERIQQNTLDFVNQFKDNPILTGIHLKNIEINTTLNLEHKLNRLPIGYIVTRRSADSTVWDTEITSDVISLVSSASVTIDLWVF